MSTPEPDAFPAIVSLWPVANGVRTDVKQWMGEYLAAYDRQNPLPDGRATPDLRSTAVRHAAIVSPEEQTPALVVWIAGVTDHTTDPDSGLVLGTVQLGVTLIASSKDTASTGDLLHRYAACVKQLLWDVPTAGGHAQHLELLDEDYTPIDPLRERTLLGADLSYAARRVVIGNRRGGPPVAPGDTATPRADPSEPWPSLPTTDTTHLTVDPEDTP